MWLRGVWDMTKPNGYRVNGTMYPARTDLCEQAMLDYIWELEEERDHWTQRWIDERAENKGLIDANVEVANINAGLLVEVEALREALETISRLEPYDGNRHVYHSAGKVARKALAL